MKVMDIANITVYVLVLVLGWVALWYRNNAKVSSKVAELIAAAEKEYQSWTNAGQKKFEWVVDQLYALIPAPIRTFVPRTLVSKLVQTTFDAVEGYAGLQMDKLTAKAGKKEEIHHA